MRTFAAAILASVTSAITQTDFEFLNYIAKFGKSYDNAEEFVMRSALFAKFDAEIKEINARETTSVHGHNFLSDWTAEEKAKLDRGSEYASKKRPSKFYGVVVQIRRENIKVLTELTGPCKHHIDKDHQKGENFFERQKNFFCLCIQSWCRLRCRLPST